jgi:virulence-associated protein VagC
MSLIRDINLDKRSITMMTIETEQVMSVDALQAFLTTTLSVKRVLVRQNNHVVTIEPVEEKTDCTIGLRGILADCPEMSVDKFLERKHADRELDL